MLAHSPANGIKTRFELTSASVKNQVKE